MQAAEFIQSLPIVSAWTDLPVKGGFVLVNELFFNYGQSLEIMQMRGDWGM